MHDPFCHWMSRHKPLSSTLFSIAAPQLIFLSLMTWEIILNRANDFCLQEIQDDHDVDRNSRNAHDVDLHPDGLRRGSNVFQKSIHPVGWTHEILHRRTLFLDKYESTLARPIHTHNKDPHFGWVSSVSALSSRDHWSPVLILLSL